MHAGYYVIYGYETHPRVWLCDVTGSINVIASIYLATWMTQRQQYNKY